MRTALRTPALWLGLLFAALLCDLRQLREKNSKLNGPVADLSLNRHMLHEIA